tara:strand:+ start:1941 stop:2612 length:672 start_codon:yes stop_codon:yes gene_type:complete
MKKIRQKMVTFGTMIAALAVTFNASASTDNASINTQFETDTPADGVTFFPMPADPINEADLKFHNLHTEERITFPYSKGQGANDSLNWFMRDFRRGEAAHLDTNLLDLLTDIKTEINKRYPELDVEFQVISAYRSSETNSSLRKAGGGQAKVSQHTRSTAMDIHVPGVSSRELRDIATCLKKGGVGYYKNDDFVHVDTARVRYWPSRAYLSDLSCNLAPVAHS